MTLRLRRPWGDHVRGVRGLGHRRPAGKVLHEETRPGANAGGDRG